MLLTMDKINFGQWLQSEREKRDLSQSDLARITGLHRHIINKTENGVSMPAVETYLALAKAFGISPVSIFRKAGLLPEGGDNTNFEDWQHLLTQLTPDGYKTSSKGLPAQLIPHEAQAIIQMKDWYLQGINLKEICDRLDQMGIKPKRAQHWTRTVVRRTVTNPYYAGITIFGKYKTENKNRIPQPPSQWVRGKGQHIALWDEQTYFAILAEQDRRHSLRARAKYYALTGVLKCSICGTSVHRHGKQGTNFIYMNCSSPQTHIITRYDKLLPLVADAVIQAIQTYKNDPAAIDSTEHITEKIHTQQTLRQRVQEGYEVGLYNQLEAQKKIVAAENEIERLTRARDRAAHQHRQKQAMLQFAEQDLNRMRAWIIEDDPATVNVFLTSLCENMIISPENQIIVIFRT